MNKTKVLFIDDDLLIGSVITISLQSKGYNVHYQSSIAGLKNIIFDFQPHIIILDVEIGADNGIDTIPMIRSISPGVPVIFVSSHVESSTVVRAISSGAEVYLKKPFDTKELIAYIEKYTSENTPLMIVFGNCKLNLNTRTLNIGNHEEKLSISECKLLKILAINKNNIVSRTDIEKTLFKESEVNEYSTNNLIAKLRKLIATDSSLTLETKRMVGYCLRCNGK